MAAILQILCPCMRYDNLDGETAMVSRYQGERNCLGQKHGYGVFMFANGDLYEGCWKFNKMHGFGVYTQSSGEKRDGFFRNGIFMGKHSNQSTVSSDEYVQPQPFPQTVRDEEEEAYEAQRKLEREKRRSERQKRQFESQKRREEFNRKYGATAATEVK